MNSVILIREANKEYTLVINGKPIPSATVGATKGMSLGDALAATDNYLTLNADAISRLDGDYTDSIDPNTRYTTTATPASFTSNNSHNIQTVDKAQ